jgi:hypothetical protein
VRSTAVVERFIFELRIDHDFRRFVQDILCVARIADKSVLLAEYMQMKSSHFESQSVAIIALFRKREQHTRRMVYTTLRQVSSHHLQKLPGAKQHQ